LLGTYRGVSAYRLQPEEVIMDEPLRVLVVDDDSSIRNIVQETLSDGGFEPKAASLGEEAIALLNAHSYRAVIIGIVSGKDHVKGWAVARRARAFNPALPIIYITGGSTDEWAIQGVPNSILITKPFAPAKLLTAVSRLLNTGHLG
jgi:DNA-binding response OmpR family regulator